MPCRPRSHSHRRSFDGAFSYTVGRTCCSASGGDDASDGFEPTILLWIGAGALTYSLFGAAALDTARALALLGCIAFTAVWSAFLVVGNYFSYWFGHEGAQNTHYQMTLWGIGVMILLTP